MPYNENNWNRNRDGFARDWNNNDDFNRNQNRNENDFENRGNWGDRGNDHMSNYRENRNDFNDDRRNLDRNDNQRFREGEFGNRGRYGNSTGVSRGSSNYLGRNDRDNNREGNYYAGSDYGSFNRRNNNDNNRGNDRDWWDKTKDEVSSWFGDDAADRRRQMDERRGQHRGKGPKGYTRSDDRIKEDVNDRLSNDEHIDASDIEVEVSNGEVTLTGNVNSRWEKRHAEDIAEEVSGVKNVENRVRVTNNTSTTGNNTQDSNSGATLGTTSSGPAYGSAGAAPVGAFDTRKN